MAFNPFNVFRRNQRALFAVVTVFIMFTFVLSSGLGGGADFFDWLPGWLGKNKKGAQLCTLEGSKVSEGDVQKLRFRRHMANKFMELAATVAEDNFQRTLSEMIKALSPQSQQMMQTILFSPEFQDPRLLEMIAGNMKPEEKEILKVVQAAKSVGQIQQYASQTHHYFLNAPNRSTRDVIDFMIWEKKADEMGIRFTDDDIKLLIQKEFYGQFKSDVEVRKYLEKDLPGFNLDTCIRAIGDEFRVRAVQTALLGPVWVKRDDMTLSAPPIYDTPYELYDFYREKVSPTTYWAIPVPVANFADRVTGKPTDAELRAIYDKYKDQEFDPAKEDPGIRQPRRVKVEWVGATGTEPYYIKKADELLAKAEEYRKLEIGALAVPLPGVGPGFIGLAIAPGVASDPLIYQKYQFDVAFTHDFLVRRQFSSSNLNAWDLLNTSLIRPANLAAISGGMIGGLAGFGGPAEAAGLLYGGGIKFEQFDRIRAGMPLFGGAIPGPGMESTLLGGTAGMMLGYPAKIPIDVYRPMLMTQVKEHKAKELVQADLTKLKTDLQKIADDKEIKTPAEKTAKAREAVAAFIKERGLTTGSTTDFRDEWNIEDDPGMAPLKAAMKGSGKVDPHSGLKVPIRFGKKFFWRDDFSKFNPRDPMAMQMIQAGIIPQAPATGTYLADFYTSEAASEKSGDPMYLFWRTEEKPATSLTFDQAKSTGVLEAAWKRIKGRELAKNKADEIANRLRGRSASAPGQVIQNVQDEGKILKDEFRGNEKAFDRVNVFKIDNVAPLAVKTQPGPPQTGGMLVRSVSPFRLDTTTDIPYPTADFAKTLLDDRTKPVGTVLVLADQPKDIYYVVALVNRQVLSPREFGSDVFAPLPQQGQVGAGVQRAYNREAMKKAYDSVLDLLKKEFEYVETEDQKKRIDANSKEDSDQ